jgi:glycogen debranching enzyme
MYHNGTVWPHDNSLISAGLQRYGFRAQVNHVVRSMFQAAEFTGLRLPEVFAGYPRADSYFPVRYPTASSPQAWATAAPFLWLRLILGLDVRGGEVAIDPMIPPDFGMLKLTKLHAAGRLWNVTAHGTDGTITPAD